MSVKKIKVIATTLMIVVGVIAMIYTNKPYIIGGLVLLGMLSIHIISD